jgi:hypothetical protein
MSTFRTPVGPQPSRVYWRRRLVVGLGLLAVAAIIILIIVRPGAGTPTPPSATRSPTPTATSTSTASAAPKVCDPERVTVEAVTDATNYSAGVNPVLSFTLKSTMTVPCTVAAGSDVQEFRITSGDELIWTSKDCQTEPVAAVTVLEPGVPKAGPTLPWDRTRSSPATCGQARAQVIAGGASYHLAVIVGDLTSPKTKQFLLN